MLTFTEWILIINLFLINYAREEGFVLISESRFIVRIYYSCGLNTRDQPGDIQDGGQISRYLKGKYSPGNAIRNILDDKTFMMNIKFES